MLRLFCVAIFLFQLGMHGIAQASVPYVTSTYQSTTEGYFLQFVVHNAVDGYSGNWTIATGDATSPTAPEGWRIHQDFRQVGWDVNEFEYAIQPYQSLAGFGFTSQNPPGTLGWWIFSGGWGYNGSVTPTLIPEPSSILALGLAVSGLGAWVVRKRRV